MLLVPAPASPSVPGEGWRQLTHTEMKREEGLGQQDPESSPGAQSRHPSLQSPSPRPS